MPEYLNSIPRVLNRVCTGPGKSGKSWKKATGPGKFWKSVKLK